MGSFGEAIAGIFTGRAGRKQRKRTERASAAIEERPVKTVEAVAGVEEQRKDIKKRRVNLFETAGGVSGQELDPTQITKRKTLFGN